MEPVGMSDARKVVALVNRIRPVLAGQPPQLVGAALADLLAVWLVSHSVEGDENATRDVRAELLANHCGQVRRLTTVNAKILGTTP